MNNEDFNLQIGDENENFDLSVDDRVENFNLTPDENVESFGLSPNDEDEEFTVEFGEVINDGGTHDYNELDNKPQINGNTLEGNKTNEQLGIPVYTEGAGITLSGNTISADTDVLATKADLNSKQNVIADLPQIRSGAEAGATAVQPEDLARIATTGSYNDSLDKPSINNVTLTGNKSLDALGIQPKGDYALESEIPDVSNFITNTVDDLVNYYKKSETFTKQEVNDLISAITTMDIRVVQTLPTEDISATTIYLVPKATAGTNDAYDEYIYVSNAWEHIGSTEVDLTDYVKNTDYAGINTGGVVKVNASYGINTANTGTLIGVTKDYSSYDSGSDLTIIDKGTLENVIEGKGLVSETDLADYVTTTDYASNNTGGVVKTNTNYGTSVDSNGSLRGTTKTYAEYDSMHNLGLISKVTLENVITGKGLVSDTDYATFSKPGLIKPASSVGTDIVSSTGIFYASTLDYATYNSANNAAFIGKGTLENVIEGKGLATKSDMPKHYFGTCATAAATRAKVVECEGFTLEEGATISIYFTYAQTYNGYPYLNVNDTGNVAVVYKGGSAGIRYMWSAGEIIDFTYHNEYWVCHGRALATTTYYGITKLSNSAISTSTSLALTPAVVNALAENMITGYDAYSASKTYAVGDRVRYSSYAYECITAIPTAEAWTSEHWKALDPLQTQIDALEARIRALENS